MDPPPSRRDSVPSPTASEKDLLSRSDELAQPEPLSVFENAVIHIDGLYLALFLGRILESSKETASGPPLEPFHQIATRFFDKLLAHNPASLTVWFAGASDMGGVTSRMNFAESRMKHATPTSILFPPGLLFGWLKIYNTDERIQTVWSAHKGEEAIPSAVAFCDFEGPFYILSDNVRLCKYEYGHETVFWFAADDILSNGQVQLTNLAQMRTLVPPEKQQMPRPAEFSDVLASIPSLAQSDYCFGAHGFINRFDRLKTLLSFLLIVYDSPVWPAWKVGCRYRSYAYSSTLEKYFQLRPDREFNEYQYANTEVTEYTKVGDQYVPTRLAIFTNRRPQSSSEYYDYSANLDKQLSTPNGIISDIVNEIQNVQGPHSIDDTMAHVIVDYFNELFEAHSGKHTDSTQATPDQMDALSKNHPVVIRVHAQLEAAIYSLQLLDNAVPNLVAKEATGLVLWRMSLNRFYHLYLKHVNTQ